MTGTFDPFLVALSFLVAVIASYTALELSRRVATSYGLGQKLWLVAGAFSMGIGIWTMHFVGMLAFSMPMAFSYNVPITIASLLVGVAASAFTIYIASRETNSLPMICLSGVFLGCGIAGMHYTGMEAMRMDATIVYDPTLVAASIAIAIVAAIAAIWIAFTLVKFASQHLLKLKIGAAIIMGIAICGMHYTGMYAAKYKPLPNINMVSGADVDQTVMAVTLAIAALMILGFTHLTIFFDYRLGVQKDIGKKLAAMVKERTAELEQQAEDLRNSKERLEHEAVERERVEKEALYLSEILDESSNEIYIFDSETLAFIKVNKGAMKNSGYERTDFDSMTPLDLKPDHDEASFSVLLEPLRSGAKEYLVFETNHKRKDDSTYPVMVHLQLFKIANRSNFVASITDMTERRDLEQQLMQAKKMESIGQLAAGIAHEINTPAQFVGDNTRFLKESFEDILALNESYKKLLDSARSGPVPQEILDQTDSAVKAADPEYLVEEIPPAIDQSLDGISRISHIVRAMKEFSHPGGKEREPVDLNKAISNTIIVASNEWRYVAEIETDLDESLPSVPCTPQSITQVVLNLIVNASHAIVDALGDSPTDKGLIQISTKRIDGYVEIRITDSGCGIPEEIRDRVFDPFFTTKEVGKGTGQGLAMAFSTIVEQHNGTLRLESTVGQGTTFIIGLPLEAPECESTPESETDVVTA
ncbi:MAG: ATP-binding protein [Gammaproteobacteria bacterium]|nr:ATP-binding protein [Gammaproteobacteria bacterium]